jgi:hypothetical protein
MKTGLTSRSIWMQMDHRDRAANLCR